MDVCLTIEQIENALDEMGETGHATVRNGMLFVKQTEDEDDRYVETAYGRYVGPVDEPEAKAVLAQWWAKQPDKATIKPDIENARKISANFGAELEQDIEDGLWSTAEALPCKRAAELASALREAGYNEVSQWSCLDKPGTEWVFVACQVPWQARDEQGVRETLSASTQQEAEQAAVEWIREGSWDTESGPVFADAEILRYGKAVSSVTVTLAQDEPRCVKRYGDCDEAPVEVHEWKDRGVFGGEAGGVNSQAVCSICNCVRTHHSRYQRRSNGAVVANVTTYQNG